MRVIKNNNINTVFGNNTGDVVFSIYSYFFKKRHINYIQDIIDRKSLLAFSIKIFDRFIFKYVTVSNAVKASLINLGLKASKIEIIYNGLEIKDNFKNKKLNKRLIFGFVGYIDDVKNPLEFVDFIKMASDNGVLCNAKMVIGKVINKTLYENLIRKIKYVGILIEIFKSLPREKMGLFYKKIDFLVITSKKEALPTVILEAFNNAVPVIGKKTGGISEIIKNNYNGYLYDTPKDFKSIINKIKKLNNYRYNIMCRNSFETVKKEFNLKQKIVKLNNILFKV